MRMSRKAGLLVSSAACGTLLLGAGGTAFAQLHDAPARADRVTTATAPDAPLPGAGSLLDQTKALEGAGGVLTPVADLLEAVLKADGGKLPADRLTRHEQAVEQAIAAAQQGNRTAPTAPAKGQQAAAKTPTEIKADALADLKTKVDGLLKAVASGDAAAITTTARTTVTAVVNVLVSFTLGSDLPAPDLAGLPRLPKLPGTT